MLLVPPHSCGSYTYLIQALSCLRFTLTVIPAFFSQDIVCLFTINTSGLEIVWFLSNVHPPDAKG